MYEADIFYQIHSRSVLPNIPFGYWKSNTPVSCPQEQKAIFQYPAHNSKKQYSSILPTTAKSNIPVSCPQQQITDRYAEPQQQKAIFQYPAHNSKSLIAMLSHSNSSHP